MIKNLIPVRHHIYPLYGLEVKYDYSTCLYEIVNARSTYKMPFKEFIDFKANGDKGILAWYRALDPESKKNVERIIKPAPERITTKRGRKKQIRCFTPI